MADFEGTLVPPKGTLAASKVDQIFAQGTDIVTVMKGGERRVFSKDAQIFIYCAGDTIANELYQMWRGDSMRKVTWDMILEVDWEIDIQEDLGDQNSDQFNPHWKSVKERARSKEWKDFIEELKKIKKDNPEYGRSITMDKIAHKLPKTPAI